MNDIIVPAERLAELLKAEHELMLAKEFGFHNQFFWHVAMTDPNLERPDRPASERSSHDLESLDDFCIRINEALKNGELASEFGFEDNGDSEVNVVIDDAGDNFCVGE